MAAVLRGVAPVVARGLGRLAPRLSGGRAAIVLRHLDSRLVERVLSGTEERHPLAPAAVRVERSRTQRRRSVAEQVAVTVWFGEGPALPAPGSSLTARRQALRVGAGLLSATAVALATTAAARISAAREIPALPRAGPPRLAPPNQQP